MARRLVVGYDGGAGGQGRVLGIERAGRSGGPRAASLRRSRPLCWPSAGICSLGAGLPRDRHRPLFRAAGGAGGGRLGGAGGAGRSGRGGARRGAGRCAPFAWLWPWCSGRRAGGVRTHRSRRRCWAFATTGRSRGGSWRSTAPPSDAVRLTLDRVVLRGHGAGPHAAPGADLAARRPALDRAGAGADGDPDRPSRPAAGPAEPGGFDFRRQAWFEGLGAVGYTRNAGPDLAAGRDGRGACAAPAPRPARRPDPGADPGRCRRLRGGGDDRRPRRAVAPPPTTRCATRTSTTSCRSRGCTWGCWSAFVFGLVRTRRGAGPAAGPAPVVEEDRGAVALPAAAFYLALAGRAVPTERAFVMVAVMLVAMLLDRRALSLRAVAVAALIVLASGPRAWSIRASRCPSPRWWRWSPRSTCSRWRGPAAERVARAGADAAVLVARSPAPRPRPSRRRTSTGSRITACSRTSSPCRRWGCW